jgi:hypothetical protein
MKTTDTSTSMKNNQMDKKAFWSGFFLVFGLGNELNDQADEIIETSVQEKIRTDIQKINSDYRKTYKKLFSSLTEL